MRLLYYIKQEVVGDQAEKVFANLPHRYLSLPHLCSILRSANFCISSFSFLFIIIHFSLNYLLQCFPAFINLLFIAYIREHFFYIIIVILP